MEEQIDKNKKQIKIKSYTSNNSASHFILEQAQFRIVIKQYDLVVPFTK
jgi:hypothetical protein